MSVVSKSVVVPYTPVEMFNLIDDIDKYHEFLPWCYQSTVLTRTDQEVQATLVIGFEGLHRSFTTANLRYPSERIEMHLVEGPFSHLEGRWQFTPKDQNACEISLDLTFGFSNKIFSMVFGKLFHSAVDTLVDAFTKRATEVYGERPHNPD